MDYKSKIEREVVSGIRIKNDAGGERKGAPFHLFSGHVMFRKLKIKGLQGYRWKHALGIEKANQKMNS